MTETESRSEPRPIGIEDWIALNDEIAALTRAGMPLERGLMGIGGDLPGRLGAITRSVSERLGRGETLPEAIHAEGAGMPPSYRAVITAGLRAGRLPEALEGLTEFARHYVELRRSIGQALVYPVVVLLAGYALFVAILVLLLPIIRETFESMRIPWVGPMRVFDALGNTAWIWGPILPIAVVIAYGFWRITGRSEAFGARARVGLRWVPGLGEVLHLAASAQFAEWLALLVDHGVAWPEAVLLAAEATGDPRLMAPARRSAEAAMRGEPAGGTEGMPPLLGWLIRAGMAVDGLVPALRHAAETYRRRSLRLASALRATLPTVLLVVIGGTATLVYVVTLFLPWTSLLSRIK